MPAVFKNKMLIRTRFEVLAIISELRNLIHRKD